MSKVVTKVVCLCVCVPARGVLAVLLCTRWSTSGLEPEDVDGPGLLSMATSDTVTISAQCLQINR